MNKLLVSNTTSGDITVAFWAFGQLQCINIPRWACNYEIFLSDEIKDKFIETAEKNFPDRIIIGKSKVDVIQDINSNQEEKRLDLINEKIDKEIETKINEQKIIIDPETDDGINIEVSNPYDQAKDKTSKPRGRKPKSK